MKLAAGLVTTLRDSCSSTRRRCIARLQAAGPREPGSLTLEQAYGGALGFTASNLSIVNFRITQSNFTGNYGSSSQACMRQLGSLVEVGRGLYRCCTDLAFGAYL